MVHPMLVRPRRRNGARVTTTALLALLGIGLVGTSTVDAAGDSGDASEITMASPDEVRVGGTDIETSALSLAVVVLAMGSACLVARRPR